MHTSLNRVAALLALLSLSACSFLPTYEPGTGQALSTVKFMGWGKPQVCVNNQLHTVDLRTIDGMQGFQVAAGERITLRTFMQYQGYNVISTCRPGVSLVPRAGTTLILNSGLDNNRCFIEAVREDNSVDTGVAPEITLGAPQC